MIEFNLHPTDFHDSNFLILSNVEKKNQSRAKNAYHDAYQENAENSGVGGRKEN